MLNEFDFIRVLEKLRTEKNMSIVELTAGIMSRRTYSRLLSNETRINMLDLVRLVDRLGFPFIEFVQYAHNVVFMENIHEYEFLTLIYNENYKDAYDNYYKKIKSKINKLRTPFAKSTTIILFILEEKMNIISKDILLERLRELVDLDFIFGQPILLDDYIEILYFYTPFATQEEKERIVIYLYETLVKNTRLILGHSVEMTTLKGFSILQRAIRKTPENRVIAIETIQAAMQYILRSSLAPEDVNVLLAMNELNDYYQISPYILFYLMAALRTTPGERFKQLRKEIYTEANVKTYLQQLEAFQKIDTTLCEEIIKNAIKSLQSA